MSNETACNVRCAGPGDLMNVLRVHAERDLGSRRLEGPSDHEQRAWVEIIGCERMTVYLAESDGDAVGTASVMTMPNVTYGCAPTAFIEAVVVAAQHRRQGVATAIMRTVLNDLRSGGCHKVQLLSHKRHAADGAHDLYTGLGFEPEAEGFRLYLQASPPMVVQAAMP